MREVSDGSARTWPSPPRCSPRCASSGCAPTPVGVGRLSERRRSRRRGDPRPLGRPAWIRSRASSVSFQSCLRTLGALAGISPVRALRSTAAQAAARDWAPTVPAEPLRPWASARAASRSPASRAASRRGRRSRAESRKRSRISTRTGGWPGTSRASMRAIESGQTRGRESGAWPVGSPASSGVLMAGGRRPVLGRHALMDRPPGLPRCSLVSIRDVQDRDGDPHGCPGRLGRGARAAPRHAERRRPGPEAVCARVQRRAQAPPGQAPRAHPPGSAAPGNRRARAPPGQPRPEGQGIREAQAATSSTCFTSRTPKRIEAGGRLRSRRGASSPRDRGRRGGRAGTPRGPCGRSGRGRAR